MTAKMILGNLLFVDLLLVWLPEIRSHLCQLPTQNLIKVLGTKGNSLGKKRRSNRQRCGQFASDLSLPIKGATSRYLTWQSTVNCADATSYEFGFQIYEPAVKSADGQRSSKARQETQFNSKSKSARATRLRRGAASVNYNHTIGCFPAEKIGKGI